jgi:hypothetical protein
LEGPQLTRTHPPNDEQGMKNRLLREAAMKNP